MSECIIRRCPTGGYWLINDEGERDWFPSYEAAWRASGGRALED